MKIVVGLGNPGDQYRGTRHNIGYEVVSALLERHGASLSRAPSRLRSMLATVGTGEGRALIVVPTTFMNDSGQAVRSSLDYHKVAPASMIVVHDDIAEVDQYPFTGGFALRAQGINALLLRLRRDMAGEGFDVPIGGAAGEHEVVHEVRQSADIQRHGIDCLEFVEGRGDKPRELFRFHAAKVCCHSCSVILCLPIKFV